MANWLAREKLLIGEENVQKLNSSTVAVFGCGGVGSYAVEALARAGVGNIVLIDGDVVDETNINRQLIADVTTIGRDKVEVEKDYIIDAIDSVNSKILLIQLAHEKNIKIISAMGMGNKLEPTMIEVADISKTEVCPLAKTIRKQLRTLGIKHTKVVYSKEIPKQINDTYAGQEHEKRPTASISFVPSVCGLIMAGEVIKDILGCFCGQDT